MFFEDLGKHLVHAPAEYDLLARITQHPDRPKPNRAVDQIYMLPGSQLNQAKLMGDYLRHRAVTFVGDGDCMSLVVGILAKQEVIEWPDHMWVFDFDERLVHFISKAAQEFGFHERLEAHYYNVRDPVPSRFAGRSNVFYTNPPYGSKNGGMSGMIFLARCMEFCQPVGSWGVAILPFHHNEAWSRDAMYNIQKFLVKHGYVVSEMLRGMHSYHLDDAPTLLSGTLVMDRVQNIDPPYRGRALTDNELEKFYGESQKRFPDRISLDGDLIYSPLQYLRQLNRVDCMVNAP